MKSAPTPAPVTPVPVLSSAGAPPVAPAPRPGWPDVIAGVAVAAATTALLALGRPLGIDGDPTVWGLVLTGWAGVAGLAGFAAAALVRRRPLATFSVRRASGRWTLVGAIAGILAFLLKGVVNLGVIAVLGPVDDPQGSYYDAAGGGALALVATFALFAVLTPLGEELLFRGVITNALLRFGPVIGVLSGSAIFALVHGINLAMPSAFVVGVIAAEVMRRSGSIWPAVLVHSLNNLALPIFAIVLQATGAA